MIGARNTVSPHQRATIHAKTDHHELTVVEPKSGITRGAEAKYPLIPVMDVQDGFFAVVGHAGREVSKFS